MYKESCVFQQLNEPARKIEESFAKLSEGILTSSFTEVVCPKDKLKLRTRKNKNNNKPGKLFILTPYLIAY